MNNLKKNSIVELSSTEMKKIDGGIPWLLGAAIAYSIFSVMEYPDAFMKGVNSTFESSL